VAALSFVDCAFVLPDDFVNRDDHRNLIATIRPNILAVSSHSPFIEKKQQIMSEFGGSVKVVHQHNPQVSTTEILKKSAT
jgi:bifunctional ADP-heptose synthase (sugar kinase/adenylyltransferase)